MTFHLLPLSIDVLDEAVGNPVPGERLVGRLSEPRVPTKMGGGVDHWHRGLVTVDVVALAERVHDVQLDVGEGDHGVEHEGLKLVVAAQVLAHRADALPVVHHVLVQVRLYGSRICNKLSK